MVGPHPDRPTPRRSVGLLQKLAPWVAFAVVAVVVVATTSLWSATLGAPQDEPLPQVSRLLTVPPGPPPVAQAAPPRADADPAEPDAERDGAPPTVLRGTVPAPPPAAPAVIAAPAAETVPVAVPPVDEGEALVPGTPPDPADQDGAGAGAGTDERDAAECRALPRRLQPPGGCPAPVPPPVATTPGAAGQPD